MPITRSCEHFSLTWPSRVGRPAPPPACGSSCATGRHTEALPWEPYSTACAPGTPDLHAPAAALVAADASGAAAQSHPGPRACAALHAPLMSQSVLPESAFKPQGRFHSGVPAAAPHASPSRALRRRALQHREQLPPQRKRQRRRAARRPRRPRALAARRIAHGGCLARRSAPGAGVARHIAGRCMRVWPR